MNHNHLICLVSCILNTTMKYIFIMFLVFWGVEAIYIFKYPLLRRSLFIILPNNHNILRDKNKDKQVSLTR